MSKPISHRDFTLQPEDAERLANLAYPFDEHLPKHQKSGLNDAIEVLRGLDGISFTFFTARDVVCHPLVARIVEAYDTRDGRIDHES